jgi:hypothetical protein
MTVVALVVNGVLRIVIIVVAGFSIWQFSDGFLLAWETLADPTKARWFNVLSALGEGLLGPVLALAAIALSATNQHLFLAPAPVSRRMWPFLKPRSTVLSSRTKPDGPKETTEKCLCVNLICLRARYRAFRSAR